MEVSFVVNQFGTEVKLNIANCLFLGYTDQMDLKFILVLMNNGKNYSTSTSVFTFGQYQLNKMYFGKQLCELSGVPQIICNGISWIGHFLKIC